MSTEKEVKADPAVSLFSVLILQLFHFSPYIQLFNVLYNCVLSKTSNICTLQLCLQHTVSDTRRQQGTRGALCHNLCGCGVNQGRRAVEHSCPVLVSLFPKLHHSGSCRSNINHHSLPPCTKRSNGNKTHSGDHSPKQNLLITVADLFHNRHRILSINFLLWCVYSF